MLDQAAPYRAAKQAGRFMNIQFCISVSISLALCMAHLHDSTDSPRGSERTFLSKSRGFSCPAWGKINKNRKPSYSRYNQLTLVARSSDIPLRLCCRRAESPDST